MLKAQQLIGFASGRAAGFGDVVKVGAWDATTVNAALDLDDAIGFGWLVVMAVNGAGGGMAVPAAPQLDGVPMTLRVSQTSYCADDGAMGAIWAIPLTSDLAGNPHVLTFTQVNGGYTPPRQVAFKVRGVAVTEGIFSTINFVNCAGTQLTLNTPVNGCAFVLATSAKGGAAGVYDITNAELEHGPMGADRNTFPGGNITYTWPAIRHLLVGMSLKYSAPAGGI